MCNRYEKYVILFYSLIAILLVGCATLTTQLIKHREIPIPSILFNKAFDYVIMAGEDTGFELVKVKPVDKEIGLVKMVSKGALVKSLLLPVPMHKGYILKVSIKREETKATGIEMEISQIGGFSVRKKEMEEKTRALS